MNRGKHKCETLKKIRQMIADRNGIDYHTTECKFQGNCSGTCPKCEAELRYLENQLKRKESAGKKVAVAGLALGISLVTSCGPSRPAETPSALDGDVTKIVDTIEVADTAKIDSMISCQNPVAATTPKSEATQTKAPAQWEEIEVLEGDVKQVNDFLWLDDGDDFEIVLIEEDSEDEEDKVFPYFIVDEPPEFPGEDFPDREMTWWKFCHDNIQYPVMALENEIQGIVLVQFEIDQEGNVTNPKIVRGVDPLLNKEALRIVSSSPKWKPAKHGGEYVKTLFESHVKFKLPE